MLGKPLKIGIPALLGVAVLTAGAGAIEPTVPVAEAHSSCNQHWDHAGWRLVQHHHTGPQGRVVHHHHWWRGNFSIAIDCPPHYPYPRPLPYPRPR